MFVDGAGRQRAAGMGPAIGRLLAIALIVLSSHLAAALPAVAAKFSALAVDARTGKVLFAVDPDGIRHPASLTKMMTLYMLFAELKAGRMKLDSPIVMSARAAAMAPSKLGVKAGTAIPAETAIKALVVLSANDVAAAVGEHLGGTESAFAERMTRMARSLGMSRTTFRNASGLPNKGQVTTARDMATLGLRLQRDFPEYYPYFGTLAFTYGKRTVKTHNRLLGKYEGADGIKTGYIAASGFNLTTSARREDKRLVGVVMGGKSAAARNAYMAKMLDRNFPKCVGGSTIAALVGPAKGAVEAPAPEAAEPVDAAALSDLAAGSGKEAAGTTIKAVTADKTSPKSAGEPAAVEAPVDAPAGSKDVPVAADTQPADGTAQPPVQNAAVAAIPPDGSWHIQIGSYDRKEDATERVQKLRAEGPAELRGKPAFMVTVQKGTDITYKARFSGFTRKAARATCRQIHRQKLSCYVLAPKS